MATRHVAAPVFLALLFGWSGTQLAERAELVALPEERQPYPWLTDLDEAREVAASQNKPLLLVFRCVP